MPGEGKTNHPQQLPVPLAASRVAVAGGSGFGGRLASRCPQLPGFMQPTSASSSRRPCGSASRPGWARHVADLGWEDNRGAISSLLAEAHP